MILIFGPSSLPFGFIPPPFGTIWFHLASISINFTIIWHQLVPIQYHHLVPVRFHLAADHLVPIQYHHLVPPTFSTVIWFQLVPIQYHHLVPPTSGHWSPSFGFSLFRSVSDSHTFKKVKNIVPNC